MRLRRFLITEPIWTTFTYVVLLSLRACFSELALGLDCSSYPTN